MILEKNCVVYKWRMIGWWWSILFSVSKMLIRAKTTLNEIALCEELPSMMSEEVCMVLDVSSHDPPRDLTRNGGI